MSWCDATAEPAGRAGLDNFPKPRVAAAVRIGAATERSRFISLIARPEECQPERRGVCSAFGESGGFVRNLRLPQGEDVFCRFGFDEIAECGSHLQFGSHGMHLRAAHDSFMFARLDRLLVANTIVVSLLIAGVCSLIFDFTVNRLAGAVAFAVGLVVAAALWILVRPTESPER